MPAGYDPGRVPGKAAREKRRPPTRGGPGRIRSSILPGPRIAAGSAPDKAHPGRKREGRPSRGGPNVACVVPSRTAVGRVGGKAGLVAAEAIMGSINRKPKVLAYGSSVMRASA